MLVARLSVGNFRSDADALVDPGPGFVVLTGENGAGKTNMLEAVSLLSPGRGLRGASLSEMARSDGPGGLAVAARLSAPSPQGERASEVDIGTGATAAARAGTSRRSRRDDEAAQCLGRSAGGANRRGGVGLPLSPGGIGLPGAGQASVHRW